MRRPMTQTPIRVQGRLLALTLTVLMAFGAGTAAAQSVSPSPLASPAPQPTTPTLEDQLAASQAELAQVTAQRDGLQKIMDTLDTQYNAMEASRQLLLEMRKTLPDGRTDAEAYLGRIQKLANLSDPEHLGQPASRMMETAPTYLDWRDQSFPSQAEADAAFLSSGAAGFSSAFDELKDAILLDAANQLDALLTLRDRIR